MFILEGLGKLCYYGCWSSQQLKLVFRLASQWFNIQEHADNTSCDINTTRTDLEPIFFIFKFLFPLLYNFNFNAVLRTPHTSNPISATYLKPFTKKTYLINVCATSFQLFIIDVITSTVFLKKLFHNSRSLPT